MNALRRGHWLPGLLFCALLVLPARGGEAAPQTITASEVLRGHFAQDRELAGFSKPLRSEGSFVLAPGTGLIWRGEKPFANETVITAGGIVQRVGDQEAMRLPASQLPGLSRLYDVLGAALAGDIAPLRKTFSVAQSGSGEEWHIMLTPLQNSAAAAQIKSLTLSGHRFVDTVDIERGGGDRDHIAFTDQAVSQNDLSREEKTLLQTVGK